MRLARVSKSGDVKPPACEIPQQGRPQKDGANALWWNSICECYKTCECCELEYKLSREFRRREGLPQQSRGVLCARPKCNRGKGWRQRGRAIVSLPSCGCMSLLLLAGELWKLQSGTSTTSRAADNRRPSGIQSGFYIRHFLIRVVKLLEPRLAVCSPGPLFGCQLSTRREPLLKEAKASQTINRQAAVVTSAIRSHSLVLKAVSCLVAECLLSQERRPTK